MRGAVRTIFVSLQDYANHRARGGVQWCTQDYLRTLEAVGWKTEMMTFSADQRWIAKMSRRLAPRPFKRLVPPSVVDNLVQQLRERGEAVVFLNNTSALSIAPKLRERLGKRVKLVFLSHGAEVTDLVNGLRLQPDLLPVSMRSPHWLGSVVLEEIKQRQAIDLAVCISEPDLVFEQWLGTSSAIVLPRTIVAQPIPCQSIAGRVGLVSTLNHGPNLDGIRRLAFALKSHPALRLRLVGGPPDIGVELQNEFSSIEYLGPLDDVRLTSEASTWCAFVNPVFCQARGASTKVATALSWGMPVLTTVIGSRGYVWDDRLIARKNSPEELAAFCAEISQSDHAIWWQRALQLGRLSPTFEQSGQQLVDAVNALYSGRRE